MTIEEAKKQHLKYHLFNALVNTLAPAFCLMTTINLLFFPERPEAINLGVLIGSILLFIFGRSYMKTKWYDYLRLVHLKCSGCGYEIFSEQTPEQADGICIKCGENNRVTQNT